jgi:hypothetical protein
VRTLATWLVILGVLAGAAAAVAAGGGFLLRPAPTAAGCTPPVDLPDVAAPAAVRRDIGVLRRARRAPDGLPVLNRPDHRGSADSGWLPLHSLDWRGVRRADALVAVVPSAQVLRLDVPRVGVDCGARIAAPTAAGACVVVGRPAGGPFAVRCWTLDQIDAGRAVALAGGRLVGLIPSRARALEISFGAGRSLSIPTGDGVIDRVTGLRVGTRLVTRILAPPGGG